MNEIKKNIQQKELHSKDEDEIIINFDEFGTISDLEAELFSSLKNETSKKLNNNNKNNISREHKIKKISPITYSLTNKTFCQSNLISKDTTLLSKDNSNSIIRKKKQRVKSPVKKIILNGGNDGCSHHSNQKSIFSKISEILYNSYNDEISQHKSLLNYKNSQEDNYNQMTSDQYLYKLADKQNNHIKNSLIAEKMENKKYQKILNENHYYSEDKNEEMFSTKRYYRRRIRTPEEFLEDQAKFLDKHNKHIEKMVTEQNKKFQKLIKDKPSISNDSRKIANNLRKTGDKNIFDKLYNDFSLREKNREEIIKKRYDNINGMNKTLSKEMIKQNSERLYKEYLKKKSFLSENKNKQNKYFKNMVLTKFANKNSNHILYHKFLTNYKNILNSQFNKTLEDNFEINCHDYLKIIKELGVINDDYISEFKNEEEKSHKNIMKELNLHNFANIWKGNNNNNMINLNRSTNFKVLGNNRKSITKKKQCKNKVEYKLIKDSWKIITKTREFNMEQNGNTKRLLYFFLSLLGIYDGNLNNTFIKNELPFLLEQNKNIIDENLSKQIFKFFYNFRKLIFENLIYKKNSNNIGKISIPIYSNINRKSKRLRNANSNQNRYMKTIFNISHQKSIRTKRIEKDNFNAAINNKDNSTPKRSILSYYDFEENKNSYKNELNKMSKFINSTIKNENENEIQIKKMKFVFQIKIGDEPKKLIIYEKEDKMKKIEEFCEIYNLDSYEKQQIISVVKQKFGKI